MDEARENLIKGLFKDVIGAEDTFDQPKDKIHETITDILHTYNLSTDMSFVQKIASMKFTDQRGNVEKFDINSVPMELKDAAFLPVNTIVDINIREDIDLMISQIPEWFTALIVTRDAICESDVATGKIARDIRFDNSNLDEDDDINIMSKIETVEDRLDLHSIIKNHMVFDTLEYGEGYIYTKPYAKVFEDLYKYRINCDKSSKSSSVANMFETSPELGSYGYGFGEQKQTEISLYDSIVQEQAVTQESTTKKSKKKEQKPGIFTESEIIEMRPQYHSQPIVEDVNERKAAIDKQEASDKEFDEAVEFISKNIRYIEGDVSLPVIESSPYEVAEAYKVKYANEERIMNTASNMFETVMESGDDFADKDRLGDIDPNFANIKGIYIKILPGTKLIPVRVDRTVIGYYYISDMTRPEESGQRKNSGLGGYTLRSPSVGYDTFAPDRMFCEKLANKIISGFNLKFMRDNVALHEQIISILESHNFNNSMLRFIFIPAENVVQCTINKDGAGKGHSMLEPGLVTARMYMFLKLYSILYQINNSEVRVYNLNMSGIDLDYKGFVQDTIRKFTSRRISTNDIFNYRSAMNKVNGGSELIMPVGTSNKPPITFETIPASSAPINNDLLENLKNEAINSTPVPSAMVQGAMSELDFAKEVELANTRFTSMISSYKIDMNRDITRLYRKILRWETDIDPNILKDLKFVLRMPSAKELNITNEMINNFNSITEMIIPTFLSQKEINGDKKNGDVENQTTVVREYRKLLISELIPCINVERFAELADIARDKANDITLDEQVNSENLTDQELDENEEL